MYMPWFADAVLVLQVFGVVLVAFHIALLAVWPQTDRFWQRIDYVWLALAATGIWGTASEATRLAASHQVEVMERRVEWSMRHLADFVGDSAIHCRDYVRSPVSPDDFDELVTLQNELCQWAATAADLLPASVPATVEDLVVPDDLSLPLHLRSQFGWEAEFIDHNRGVLLDRVEEWREAIQRSRRSDLDTNLLFFTPSLLLMAIAIRMTKVTASLCPPAARPRFGWAARLAHRIRRYRGAD